jgi:hypothetical protein
MSVAVIERTAQDLGAAVLLGGNLFGRLAMHPALEGVCGPEERGQVVNRAWRRFGALNSLSLAAIVAGWAAERSRLGDPRLARAKDAAVGAVAVTGLATAAAGVRFNAMAPGGAVPLRDGTDPGASTPASAARVKRLANGLGNASAVAELALVAINAAVTQEQVRRRRLFSRR